MKEKLLIYGIGSFKNHGCEAIVNATVKNLDKEKYFISLACHDIDYNSKYYSNLIDNYIKHSYSLDDLEEKKKQQYYNFAEKKDFLLAEEIMYKTVIDEVENHDFFISAGGDNYSYGYSYWLYAIHNEIKKQGKKSVLWGASLYDKLVDPELITDLKKYDLLLLRESISYAAAKEYIDESKLLLAPDPAFALVPSKVKLNDWYSKRDIVMINVSPLTIKDENQYKSIVDFINYLLSNTKYSVLLLPHVLIDGCNDLDILRRLKDDFSVEERVYLEESEYDCSQLKYIISKCKIAIAARTHASIAAYSSLVPTVVIGYSVKSRGIDKDLFGTDSTYVIPNELLSYENLLFSFNYILDNYNEIKKMLTIKCEEYEKLASNLMTVVKDRLDFLDKKTVCSKEKCSGCGACFKLCAKGAIEMVEDEEGFIYPVIDNDKCNSCNLCRKSCPVLNKVKKDNKVLCYVAKNKDVDIQKNSSSGGVFSALANYFFDKKGVVYGAILGKNDYVTKHIRAINKDELVSIRGSKYTQSNSFLVFADVKKDLEEKRCVLFSGTPCQVAGLKSYLKKEYNNLTTVSVICHGVASNKHFQKYLDEIMFDRSNDSNYFHFRDSRKGWSIAKVSYKTEFRSVVEPFRSNPFMNLYVNNQILRDSCYECSFKGIDNQKADIILGDYWGVINYHEDMFDENGVSCVIALTDNGKKILSDKKVGNTLMLKETLLENIINGNSLLASSPNKPFYRCVVGKNLVNNTFEVVSDNFSFLTEKNELEKLLKKVEIELSACNEQNRIIINSKGWRLLEKIRRILRRK